MHLLGLGGAGVSGAARLLAAAGITVSGHDRAPGRLLDGLEALGVRVELGPSKAGLLPPDARLVVRSAAVPLDDPQVVEALRRGTPVWKYAELLAHLAPGERTLAVAGTHGKTSTSWMLLHALRASHGRRAAAAAEAPGGLIGGSCQRLGVNALPRGADGAFVVEACEYDRSFLQLAPQGALITNIEADHLDCYGSLEGLIEGFREFAGRVRAGGVLVLGRQVPEQVERGMRCRILREGRDFRAVGVEHERGHYRFEIEVSADQVQSLSGVRFELSVPGAFSVDNAVLALVLASVAEGAEGRASVGVGAEGWVAGLAQFRGAARRFEPWGTVGGIDVVHDYAHHPTELSVTLAAAAERFPGRPLKILFQPHQYTRTHQFLEEFAEALRSVDGGLVCDVYGARSPGAGAPSASAEDLVRRATELGARIGYGGALEPAVGRFVDTLAEGDAALVVGAGDIDSIRHDLLQALALRSPAERSARSPHDAQGRG